MEPEIRPRPIVVPGVHRRGVVAGRRNGLGGDVGKRPTVSYGFKGDGSGLRRLSVRGADERLVRDLLTVPSGSGHIQDLPVERTGILHQSESSIPLFGVEHDELLAGRGLDVARHRSFVCLGTIVGDVRAGCGCGEGSTHLRRQRLRVTSPPREPGEETREEGGGGGSLVGEIFCGGRTP